MAKRSVLLAAVFFFLASLANAGQPQAGSDAVVTSLEGTAQVFSKDGTTGRTLRKGDHVGRDQQVRVGDRSRLELRFPDGTVMRLSERSRLSISDVQYNKKTESKSVKVNLGIGKLWSNVRKLVTSDSSVEVKTANAVAGVRGTVYRVNVAEDKSALIRVYDGSVYVANPPRDASQQGRVSQPHEVEGPHAVPPPYHEVSMEEWTVIVSAMQQISVSADGVPSKPEDFDAKKDADDWVKWNQARDIGLK